MGLSFFLRVSVEVPRVYIYCKLAGLFAETAGFSQIMAGSIVISAGFTIKMDGLW